MNIILYSVWRCRGNWYHNTRAIIRCSEGCEVLELEPRDYRGSKSEQKSILRALSEIELIRRKFPQTKELPSVREGSQEWDAMRKEAA